MIQEAYKGQQKQKKTITKKLGQWTSMWLRWTFNIENLSSHVLSRFVLLKKKTKKHLFLTKRRLFNITLIKLPFWLKQINKKLRWIKMKKNNFKDYCTGMVCNKS